MPGVLVDMTERSHTPAVSDSLWGITAYFNPAGYKNKLANFVAFAEGVRNQNLRLLVVEAAVTDCSFEIEHQLADLIIRVRAPAVMWLKERLLNIGLNALPSSCEKVVWLDSDVLFDNQNWVEQTSELLDQYRVVQPFQQAFWLRENAPPIAELADDQARTTWSDRSALGCAFSEQKTPSHDLIRGHEGFAWAARRSLLCALGLYDRSIIGGADTIIASAMYGLTAQPFFDEIAVEALEEDMKRWMRSFYTLVQGEVTYLPGNVYHMWHGDLSKRNYIGRFAGLASSSYNPVRDLEIACGGCWQWSTNKPELHQAVSDYFVSRREEGQAR